MTHVSTPTKKSACDVDMRSFNFPQPVALAIVRPNLSFARFRLPRDVLDAVVALLLASASDL